MYWSKCYHLQMLGPHHDQHSNHLLVILIMPSLSLRRQFIFDDKQHFFKEMSIYIWALTKFPGLSKINDLTRKINQQPTPSHGMQERGAASRVKFYQIIGIQRWGIFCVFPCLDTQLYKVEGEATLQWIVIENIEQRSTLHWVLWICQNFHKLG